MIKIGERLVVQGMQVPVYVESIVEDSTTSRVTLFLDWKEHGKSRVFLHDEGSIWVKYSDHISKN